MPEQLNAVVATFSSHDAAEAAVRSLSDAGLDMRHFSIVGKGYHTEDKVVYNAGDRIRFWGANGAFWGGLWGLFFGGMMLSLPVIGHIMVVGQLASVILGAIEGALVVGGLSALGAALVSIGIPKDSVINYEKVIWADGFLIVGHGPGAEMERARAILHDAGASTTDFHPAGSDPDAHEHDQAAA